MFSIEIIASITCGKIALLGGGQFEPAKGGQFHPILGDQFKPIWGGQFQTVLGGQFDRFLHIDHVSRNTTIKKRRLQCRLDKQGGCTEPKDRKKISYYE